MSQGLGLRYSFMGPFETIHLNAAGVGDYCQLYGSNIVTVCETQASSDLRMLCSACIDLNICIHVCVLLLLFPEP